MQGPLVSILTAWYNLPFSLMFMLSVIFAIVQAVGLGGESAAEGDGDIESDADVDADGDADADLNTDGASGLDASGMFSLLAFIGMGKAPLAVIISMLLSSVAVSGWALNRVVETLFAPYPALALAGVLLLSVLIGAVATSRGSRFLGRALPPVSTTATNELALVGRMGTVVSPAVDPVYGMVRLRDRSGTMINVFATSEDAAMISQGANVMLTSYDEQKKRFSVRIIEPSK